MDDVEDIDEIYDSADIADAAGMPWKKAIYLWL